MWWIALPLFINMGKLKQYAKYLRSITEEQQLKELVAIIQRNEAAILNLNRGQLYSGIDSDGNSLAEYKSKWYADFKKTLNPKGVTDLNLTGSFHENFFFVGELPLIIWSYDEKTDELVKKYGRKIFGLTEENKAVLLNGYIREEYKAYFRKLIRLR